MIFERLKARMAEEHAKEVNALKAKIAELEGANASKSQMINDLDGWRSIQPISIHQTRFNLHAN
ncbi:hypothetical protein ABVN80_14645 [Acinetobacter baumannii]